MMRSSSTSAAFVRHRRGQQFAGILCFVGIVASFVYDVLPTSFCGVAASSSRQDSLVIRSGFFRQAVLAEQTKKLGIEGKSLLSVGSREEFEAQVDGPDVRVVMFSAPLCGPCKLMEPRLAVMQEDLASANVKVFKVNLVSGSSTNKLFSELEIKALPTFVLYKAGQVQGRVVGTKEAELRELIDGCLHTGSVCLEPAAS